MRTPHTRTSTAATISVAAGIIAWIMAALVYLTGVLGISATPMWMSLPAACAVVGIFAGHRARARAKRASPPENGTGRATIGLLLNYAIFLLIAVPFVVLMAMLFSFGRGS